MSLVQYQYIVAVDQYRHFATAAEKCFVTQPTLSMQIQKLEDQLGVLIFDRSKHPVIPTDIGQRIIDQARIVLYENQQIKALIDDEKEIISGVLRIGIIPTLSPYLLPLFITSFMSKYQDVELVVQELVTEIIIRKLQVDQLDIGLFVTPSGAHGLQEKVLFYEEFVAYVSENHPLNKKKDVDAEDIDVADTWVLNEGHCFRNQVLNICQPLGGVSDRFRFESGSLEALKKLVDKHGGITLLPELATLDMGETEQNMLHYFNDPKPVREVSLVYHRSFLKNKLTELLYKEILKSIPDDIQSKKNGTIIRWH
jgi:LysR family hydrogen peroxide-inducible transcriptional activator